MKTLQEIEQIRVNSLKEIDVRNNKQGIRIVVGMATCGIAAGAKPVMAAFEEEIGKRSLSNVTVTQTGCIGVCRLEPMVEITAAGKEKVTYVNMKSDMVKKIVAEHVVNGNLVKEYTIGYFETTTRD